MSGTTTSQPWSGTTKLALPVALSVVAFFVHIGNLDAYRKVIATTVPQYNLRNVAQQDARLQVPASWKHKEDYDTCVSEKCTRKDSLECLENTGWTVEQNFSDWYYNPVQVYKYSMGCYGNDTRGLLGIGHHGSFSQDVNDYLGASVWTTLTADAPTTADISEEAMPLVLQFLQAHHMYEGQNAAHLDSTFCNCMDDMSSSMLLHAAANAPSTTDLVSKKSGFDSSIETFLTAFRVKPPTSDSNKAHNAAALRKLVKIMVLAIPKDQFNPFKDYIVFDYTSGAFASNAKHAVDGTDVKFTATAVTELKSAMQSSLDQLRETDIYSVSSLLTPPKVRKVFDFCVRYGVPSYTYEKVTVIDTRYYFTVGSLLVTLSVVVNAFLAHWFSFEGHDVTELSTGESKQKDKEQANIERVLFLVCAEIVVWIVVVFVPFGWMDVQITNTAMNTDANLWFVLSNVLLGVALVLITLLVWMGKDKENESLRWLRLSWFQCVAKDAPLIAAVYAYSIGVYAQANVQEAGTLVTVTLIFAGAALLQHFSNILADAVQPYENYILIHFMGADGSNASAYKNKQSGDESNVYNSDPQNNNDPYDDFLQQRSGETSAKIHTLGIPTLKPLMNSGVNFYTPVGNAMRRQVKETTKDATKPRADAVTYQRLLRSIVTIRLSIAVVIVAVALVGLGFIRPTMLSVTGQAMLEAQVYVFVAFSLLLLCGFDLYYEITNSAVDNVRRAYVPLPDKTDTRTHTEELRIFLKKTYREDRPVFQAWMGALFLVAFTTVQLYTMKHATSIAEAVIPLV